MPRAGVSEYIKALAIEDALNSLNQYGRDAKLYAGGTDLLLQKRQHAIDPLYFIDIKEIPGLRDIQADDGFLRIGAAATLRDVEKSALVSSLCPALAEASRLVGSVQLKNRATVGGNLCQSTKCPYYNQSHINRFMRESIRPCFRRGGKICYATRWGNELGHAVLPGKDFCKASFGSNMGTILAALKGLVAVSSASGSRDVDIENLYNENGEVDIEHNEMITHIRIPINSQSAGIFQQYKPNPAGYTVVNTGVFLSFEGNTKICTDARIFLGGMAPGPYEAKEVQKSLIGKDMTAEAVRNASDLLCQGVTISENTMTFKVVKARVLCRGAIAAALEMARRV